MTSENIDHIIQAILFISVVVAVFFAYIYTYNKNKVNTLDDNEAYFDNTEQEDNIFELIVNEALIDIYRYFQVNHNNMNRAIYFQLKYYEYQIKNSENDYIVEFIHEKVRTLIERADNTSFEYCDLITVTGLDTALESFIATEYPESVDVRLITVKDI